MPFRPAPVTVTAAVSADEPDDRSDLIADDGEGVVGGVGNDRDDPPAICTADESTAVDETTADELLEASNTLLPFTGDNSDTAAPALVVVADDAAGTSALTTASLTTDTASSAEPGENGVGSLFSRRATILAVVSSV